MRGEERQFKEVKIKVENLTPDPISVEIKQAPVFIVVDEAGNISDKEWDFLSRKIEVEEDRHMGYAGFDEYNDDHYER